MVEFRCKLDSSKSRALNMKTFKKILWLYALLTVFLIVFGVISILFREDGSDFVGGIVLIVFGVLITPIGFLLTLCLQKRNNKASTYISE